MAKTKFDPRHIRRENAVKALFGYAFGQEVGDNQLAVEVIKRKGELDELVGKAAPEWPIDKLNRIDLAILRLAIYELLEKENPEKVVIDEAVELAKTYGAESSPRFINGALGYVVRILSENKEVRETKKGGD
jgi:N utilization substance protein B